jgi:RNA polymerase sigma-70 factor (ECF subfamily)
VTLELYYWEELSAADLGRVLGVPEGTVRTRIRRAKSLLEQALQRLSTGDADLSTTVANLEDWARSLRDQASGTDAE